LPSPSPSLPLRGFPGKIDYALRSPTPRGTLL
jgi:hypothetical protein